MLFLENILKIKKWTRFIRNKSNVLLAFREQNTTIQYTDCKCQLVASVEQHIKGENITAGIYCLWSCQLTVTSCQSNFFHEIPIDYPITTLQKHIINTWPVVHNTTHSTLFDHLLLNTWRVLHYESSKAPYNLSSWVQRFNSIQ